MNLNHDPDKHLLDQIDKLVETKQASGNTVIDELAATRPIPRLSAQNALEERLLVQLETMNQGETVMASTTSYMPILAPRRNWLPLTLLAALIVVAIAGLMLINGIGKSPKINEMALAGATTTVTATSTAYSTVAVVPPRNDSVRIPGIGNVSPVVIAVRDIPRGTVLSNQWLAVIYSGDDNSGMYSDPELLRGLTAKKDIPRWQPILPSDLTDQIVPTNLPTAIPKPTVKILIALRNLPSGYIFPELPLYDIAAYADWPADSVPPYALRQDESGVQKLWGKTLQSDVSPGQPILTSDIWDNITQNAAAPTSPTVHNTNAVQIRLSALTSDSLLPGVGGSVDVVALLPFKADSKLGDIPSTPMPDGIRFVETYVLRNTLVFYHGDRLQPNAIVAISVSPNESRILAWLAEQPQVMFRLQPPLPNAFDFSADTTIISIPIENVTVSENIQPGDRVNVISICAFVPDVMGMNNTVISSKTDCSQQVEETRAVNALIFSGEIVVEGRQPVMTYDSIALFIPKDAVPLFTKLNNANMHFKLVPATKAIQPTPTQTPLSSPTMNSTATPMPTVRIVVAYQNLSHGFSFPDNKVGMQTVAYYAAWPAESVPFDALREDANGIEQLQGKILRTDIFSQQPITLSNIEEVQSSANEFAARNFLPSDRVPVELSRALISNDGIEPVQGDWVNIVALIPLEENTVIENLQVIHSPDGKKLIASRVAFGALVAAMSSWPQRQIDSTSTPPDPSKITFAVAPDQAGLLTWLATQGITFKLELVKSADVLVPTPALQPAIPADKITIDVPRVRIQMLPQFADLQAGKSVDIIAAFKSSDIDGNAPAELQPQQTGSQITKRVAQAALIIKSGDTLTLAVSAEEAKVIQWLLDAHLALKLSPAPSLDTVVLPPHYRIDLNLDSVSHWAADGVQVGDKVDVVVGMILGDGSNLKLEFKPYAEYNWVGAPFNGKNSAQIYSPLRPNMQSNAIILRRILQNATVTAVTSSIDPNSDQAQTTSLTIEIQSESASTDGSFLKELIDVGMPYLIVKH